MLNLNREKKSETKKQHFLVYGRIEPINHAAPKIHAVQVKNKALRYAMLYIEAKEQGLRPYPLP